MKPSAKKGLIVDPTALWEAKRDRFFFKPGALSSLNGFRERGYCLSLIRDGKEDALFRWGKEFLDRETIPFTPFPITKPPKREIFSLLVLTKKTLPLFSKPKPRKEEPYFFSCDSLLPVKNWVKFTQRILYPLRVVHIHRHTQETDISIKLNLDGNGLAKVKTGIGFFDHMLNNFTKHSGVDLSITVKGDLEVDEHHTIEDTALALGEAFRKALGEKRGVERYGFILPMDESEAACSIDFSGRSHLEWSAPPFQREYVGDFPTEMLHHFYNSFCLASGLNMNLKVTGINEHHLIESSFKSFARCLRQAIRVTGKNIPSTKGVL